MPALFIGLPLGILALLLGFIALARIRGSKGLKKGKGLAIAGMALGAIGLAISAYLIVLTTKHGIANQSALSKAESHIISSREGVFYGNTAEAKIAAKRFSETMKTLRESFFEASDEERFLTKDEFVTHCEIHDDTWGRSWFTCRNGAGLRKMRRIRSAILVGPRRNASLKRAAALRPGWRQGRLALS